MKLTYAIAGAQSESSIVALHHIVYTEAAIREIESILEDDSIPGAVGRAVPTVSTEEFLEWVRRSTPPTSTE